MRYSLVGSKARLLLSFGRPTVSLRTANHHPRDCTASCPLTSGGQDNSPSPLLEKGLGNEIDKITVLCADLTGKPDSFFIMVIIQSKSSAVQTIFLYSFLHLSGLNSIKDFIIKDSPL
jgi:hypothetical protein